MIEAIPGETVFIVDQSLFFNVSGGDEDGGHRTPAAGFGGRAFLCDQYDACLHHAACHDWPGFHCEHCSYENQGNISFYLEEFLTPKEMEHEQDETE